MTEEKQQLSRRQWLKSRDRAIRKLSKTPVEIGIGKKTIPDTRELVRHYVNMALAESGAKRGYDTAQAMLEEELDLEPMDPEPPWTSKYEVSELEEQEVDAPRQEAAPATSEEGEQDIPPPDPE